MENKIKYTLNFIILALFGILTLFFLLHHEIWADEAQVWLVVRDLDVLGILKHVRTEGHPLLWYFIIAPFAKLNLPVFSMQIVNWFFVLLGASFLILKSPFNEFSKVSILISSAFLYWFPIISRSYCLIPILVFLLAWLYKKQKEHPFLYVTTIILLANTHIIMFGFCFALAVIFFYENVIQQKNKKNIILTTILFLPLPIVVSGNVAPKRMMHCGFIFSIIVLKAFCSLLKRCASSIITNGLVAAIAFNGL